MFCGKIAAKLSRSLHMNLCSMTQIKLSEFFLLRERKSEAIVPLKKPQAHPGLAPR
jgi:hypothetical protein